MTAVRRREHPGLLFRTKDALCAKDAQPTPVGANCQPRPVNFCMFPIIEPCRPCAQFCGVRDHMSMLLYLGEILLQVGSRSGAEALKKPHCNGERLTRKLHSGCQGLAEFFPACSPLSVVKDKKHI